MTATSCTRSRYRDIVVKYYPHFSAGEIAERFSVTKSRVIQVAARLQVAHTPDTVARLRQKVINACLRAQTPDVIARRGKSISRTYRMEHFRANSGMPTKTKLKLQRIPRNVQHALWYLRAKYDYFSDSPIGGPYTLYYDSQTRRNPREAYYTCRYGIKFQQA